MNYAIVNKLKENFSSVESAGLGRYWIRVVLTEVEELVTALETIIDHEPTENDYKELSNSYLSNIKEYKIKDITKYDTSDAVNQFYYQGIPSWLVKADRVGLINSTEIEKAAGKTTTKLYLNGVSIELNVDAALGMLSQLELYALDCYRTTEMHKNNIRSMSTIAEVEEYDYTQGYPAKLEF